MFGKSSKTKQLDIFSFPPSKLLCKREGRQYDDKTAWHNKFYKEVTSKIDEAVFEPKVRTTAILQKKTTSISLPMEYRGKPSRYDLNMTDGHTLEVIDKHTAEVITAISVKQGKRKIQVDGPDGKKTWRYFSKEQVEKSEVRRKVESIPYEERKKRNNVEAAIFQYCFHTRNNKTRYCTLIKHTLRAIARCA